MPADRFFFASHLQLSHEVILKDAEFHHLVNVMRLKEGDEIELVNGQGILARARLLAVEKKQAKLAVDNVEHQPRPTREIILVQALPRINRLDFIIEKGTELGATQFWLFPGFHSERKVLTEHQLERLNNLAIAAMKQCGRLYLPIIEIKPTLDQWKLVPFTAFFGDTSDSAEPFVKKNESVLFFIGPETGFSEKEVECLKRLGAKGVKIHPNILRTDTAALVALTLLS